MKALDLFCCSGGSSMGLHLAGFEVTGMDNNLDKAKWYPFDFIEQDITKLTPDYLQQYDFIAASPPCQAYSVSTAAWRAKGKEYPDLIEFTRDLIKESGVPYFIENVEGARKHLHNPIKLCGTMFPSLKVFRHRYFECSFPVDMSGMECNHEGHRVKRRRGDDYDFFSVVGKDIGTIAEWQDAMGIDWIPNKHSLAQAIPPDYSWFLAEQYKKSI